MGPRGRLDNLLQHARIWKYRVLSTCAHIEGAPHIRQPVLFLGCGTVRIGSGVEFGWQRSAAFYSGYSHVEAVAPESVIEFGDGAEVNNSAFIKSEGPGIRIGSRALIGSFVEIFDSDFHELHPDRRRSGRPTMAPVELAENVFVGDRTIILKGVTVGRDTVIGAGSVVVASLPAGVVAAGNPARVIREL